MGKIYEKIITSFDGGLSEDKRSKDFSKFSLTKHFDAFTYPHKLVPFNKTQATDSELKTQNIKKFLYGAGKLYGLGDPTSGTTTRVQVYQNDGLFSTDAWNASQNGTGTTTGKTTDVFFFYKNYIYALTGGNGSALNSGTTGKINRFDTAGGAFVDDLVTTLLGSGTIAYTTGQRQAQPVHHSADDIAYFFTDNKVHSLNNATLTLNALTLPSNQYIVSCTEYGNYLAIGCVSTDSYNARSIVYLWDRDSSLATLTERIDFGEGTLKHLFSLDNQLIAVIDFYSSDSIGHSKEGRVHIKKASGRSAIIVNEIIADAVPLNVPALPNTSYVKNNVAYFPMAAKLNGDARVGIWAINSLGRATLAIVEEDLSATQNMQGIYSTGRIWWIAHSGDGSVQRSSYLQSTGYSSTNPSLYESLIETGNDSSQNKKLISATVMFEPLATGGSTIVLKYRKNEETSWTQIFTHSSSVGSVSHSAINIESTGDNLPEFKEIQFQVSSFGGAVITGLKYKYEEKDDSLN